MVECANSPAVARLERFRAAEAKVVNKVGQCAFELSTDNRTAPEVEGRLSCKLGVARLLSDPVGPRPICYIKPGLLPKTERQICAGLVVDRATPAYGRPSSIELGATTSH